MDRHEEVLQTVKRGLVGLDPICSIWLCGSVARGEHLPTSDIDMIVVSWRRSDMTTVPSEFLVAPDKMDWQTPADHSFVDDDGDRGWSVCGIIIHMVVTSPLSHHDTIMQAPTWRLGKKRIVYDPSGILRWADRCVRQFEDDNPEVCAQVNGFKQTYERFKRDSSILRRFERLEDFMATIDLSNAVRNYKSFANQAFEATVDPAPQG